MKTETYTEKQQRLRDEAWAKINAVIGQRYEALTGHETIVMSTPFGGLKSAFEKAWDESRGSCETCKHSWVGDTSGLHFCNYLDDNTFPNDFYCGRYKPKDKS